MNNKKLMKDRKGVFGLSAVQAFFVRILALGLLAYVIVVIMGTLSGTNIIGSSSTSAVNESGAGASIVFANATGYTVTEATTQGFASPTLTSAYNYTSGVGVDLANFTLSSTGVLTNATAIVYNNLSITYAYNYYSDYQNSLEGVLTNTSAGVTSFFTAITPVYAILAVLVIILVLVVLIRVVQRPAEGSTPQL